MPPTPESESPSSHALGRVGAATLRSGLSQWPVPALLGGLHFVGLITTLAMVPLTMPISWGTRAALVFFLCFLVFFEICLAIAAIAPKGSKKVGKRLGRGHSAGQGKTSGRGQKGQKSRSGGYHKVGFEGGQMPLQRRLPKVGFRSRMARLTAELRLHELEIPTSDVIDMDVLKEANLVPAFVTKVKVIKSGKITKAVKLKGLSITKGAREEIEKAGGSIEN